MKRFEFKEVTFDRLGLRTEGSTEVNELNALGDSGWEVVQLRDDPQNTRDLVLFMQREKP